MVLAIKSYLIDSLLPGRVAHIGYNSFNNSTTVFFLELPRPQYSTYTGT